MMTAVWHWLGDNGTALGVVLAALPILWAVVQFIRIKRAEDRRVQFTTFHDLVKQLVQAEAADQAMRIDRQIAVIFELRSFKPYYPVTLRILKGLKKDWAGFAQPGPGDRLMTEIDLAIADIENKV